MKLKKLNELIMLMILAVGFSSCAKTDRPENELYIEIGNIYGKIKNASKYSNVVEVKLMVSSFGIGTIELASSKRENGGFIIDHKKTIDQNYLHTFIDNDRVHLAIIDPPETVTISNKNAKIFHANFFGFDKNGNVVTRFYPLEIDSVGYKQDVYYTYVDSDVSISGYTERESSAITYTEYDNARYKQMDIVRPLYNKITSIYSLEWKKGWNVWSFSRGFGNEINTAIENWSTELNNTLVWYSEEDLWTGTKELN